VSEPGTTSASQRFHPRQGHAFTDFLWRALTHSKFVYQQFFQIQSADEIQTSPANWCRACFSILYLPCAEEKLQRYFDIESDNKQKY